MEALPLGFVDEEMPTGDSARHSTRHSMRHSKREAARNTRRSSAASNRPARDDLVMATNNSSIVSKRSVEKIYFANEPSFFRYFVNRFQRRSPLINRGYYLRMHVIDTILRNFLDAPSDKGKVVVNLGCGSDVLPWQSLARYPDQCRRAGAKFVDVDFPLLMRRKCNIVLSTPELHLPLGSLQHTEEDDPSPILLRSQHYFQVGCDLRRLSILEDSLNAIVDRHDSWFFFVAEVSVTYMDTGSADALIGWCNKFAEAEFCLLEQIAPDDRDHPFAKTMLSHFEKLNTPLKSIDKYPNLQNQIQRFSNRGWQGVRGWTLWDAWADPYFLTPSARRALDHMEPFDEWEEFALFASHYCVVHASNLPPRGSVGLSGKEDDMLAEPSFLSRREIRMSIEPAGPRSPRRLGAAAGTVNLLGQSFVVHSLGVGSSGRLHSCDIYTDCAQAEELAMAVEGPQSRTCHSLTDTGPVGLLLAGGRTSPSVPLKDCWLLRPATGWWERIADLPRPIYRHSTTRLVGSSLALLVGGKTGADEVFNGCLLYHPARGWLQCEVSGTWIPVFGAVLACCGRVDSFRFHGLLAGGVSGDSTIVKQVLTWELDLSRMERDSMVITFKPSSITADGSGGEVTASTRLLSRFGAAWATCGQFLVIIGGAVRGTLLPQSADVLLCSVSPSSCEIVARLVDTGLQGHLRPLFVGSSAVWTDDGRILVLGGGATCFSMGTFWTRHTYSFEPLSHLACTALPRSVAFGGTWKYSRTAILTQGGTATTSLNTRTGSVSQRARLANVRRIPLPSRGDFQQVVRDGRPVILEHCNLGVCVERWTTDYITNRVGKDRKVVVHESSSTNMDFNTKNFRYEAMAFGDFIERLNGGERMYLRSLSRTAPVDTPALLQVDYPELAEDFILPPELSLVDENIFSSVLRVSGNVSMWLHYDVMANVYCQITGCRRLVVFPPSDIGLLSFAPGASSSSIDVFGSPDSPSLSLTHPQEAILTPGDVLFLPPLWLHAASPVSGTSVAVNVFFRSLDGGYSPGRDVYGNRDLNAYERGRQDICRLAASFQGLPRDAREFYIRRLADELLEKIYDQGFL